MRSSLDQADHKPSLIQITSTESYAIHGANCLETGDIPVAVKPDEPRCNTWIKICGITRAGDAAAAAGLGVDALGLILYANSPRAVAVDSCRALLAPVPAWLERVAVLVDPAADLVEAALDSGVIDVLQFHGNEPAAFCEQFGVPYIKAIRVQDHGQAMTAMSDYPSAERLLLDSYRQQVPGGTGKTFDWGIAEQLVSTSRQPVVLAGGLNAANVQAAVEQVNPFGVDVVSGVESVPGVKDLVRLEDFVTAVRAGRHGRD